MGVANVEWVAKIWCGYRGFGYKFDVKIVVVVRVGYWVQIWYGYCCSVSCEIWCWLLGLSLDCSSLMIWAENIIVQVWWYEQRRLSLSLFFFLFLFYQYYQYIYIYIYIYMAITKIRRFWTQKSLPWDACIQMLQYIGFVLYSYIYLFIYLFI